MTNHRQDALYATMCSYLGLSARDVAEIGGFSERFARDLLAGRRQFPMDTKKALFELHKAFQGLVKVGKQRVLEGQTQFYIYRTNEQLRSSPDSELWPGGFVGPYRAAMFEVWRWAAQDERKPVLLAFDSLPDTEQHDLGSET
ncbi:hypothetical protein SAMN02983003_1336 [Devosia enhydra]|uniref:Uncharacterized protein n=1 Tax=Devosia enhydra TaxID=665118 RepID=A0A1K2HVP8_9HYPH|nr:hypothetical protein [Devosia enhydra]SFZ82895.1 hypothetical protein SAMN02983003_1336 [Devosia enhydra]